MHAYAYNALLSSALSVRHVARFDPSEVSFEGNGGSYCNFWEMNPSRSLCRAPGKTSYDWYTKFGIGSCCSVSTSWRRAVIQITLAVCFSGSSNCSNREIRRINIILVPLVCENVYGIIPFLSVWLYFRVMFRYTLVMPFHPYP